MLGFEVQKAPVSSDARHMMTKAKMALLVVIVVSNFEATARMRSHRSSIIP